MVAPMTEPNRRIASLAARQHGLVVRDQVLAAGATRRVVDHRIATGSWIRVQPRVYRLSGVPASFDQELLAACLSAGDGVAVSHGAAARLLGLIDGRDGRVHISVPRSMRPRLDGVTVHRSTDLRPEHVTRRLGLPVTNPMRTIVDLAAVAPEPVVEEALDRALGRRLCTLRGVEAMLASLGRRGRRGAGALRGLLAARRGPAESELERAFLRALRRAGLPVPRSQHVVRDGGRFVARLDNAYPEARLAIELDGWESRTSRRVFQRDRVRQNELVALGWTVLRYTWEDLATRPAAVAREVRQMRGALSHPSGAGDVSGLTFVGGRAAQ